MATWPDEVKACKATAPTPWTPQQWEDKTFIISVCGPLQSNSDVAGVGVMWAFVWTCIITIVAALLKAWCLGITSRSDNGFRQYLLPGGKPRWKWMTEKRAQDCNDVLGKLIIGLADQQMVTGFAILVAAFHNKPHLTAYHFFVVTTIAAFSCLTQSIALLVLFDVIHQSLLLHTLRVLIYTVVLGMFYYAAFSSNDLTGDQGYKAMCPAWCDFNTQHMHYVEIVLAGFPVYAYILLDLARKYFHAWGWLDVMKEGDGHERAYRNELTGWRRIVNWVWWNGFQILRVLAWVYCVGELGDCLWTVFHSRNLDNYKRGGLYTTSSFDEGQWGFGQLTAVILIGLPFLSVIQELQYKFHEKKKAQEAEIPHASSPGRDAGGAQRKGAASFQTFNTGASGSSLAVPRPAQQIGSRIFLDPAVESIPMLPHNRANGGESPRLSPRLSPQLSPPRDGSPGSGRGPSRDQSPALGRGLSRDQSPVPGRYQPGSDDERSDRGSPGVRRKPVGGRQGLTGLGIVG